MDNENQPVPPVSDQQSVKNSNNLSFLKTLSYGFVIVSIGIIIAVGGYLLGANKTKTTQLAQTSATPSISPTTDPTANWKAYANQEIGIEFKYPPEWGVLKQSDELCLPEGGLTRIYNNQPCVHVSLASENSINGSFLSVDSKMFSKYPPGRGGYWGDMAMSMADNPQESLSAYCGKTKTYQCNEQTNSYKVFYVKSLQDEQAMSASRRKAAYYLVLNKNENFPIIVLSNQGFLGTISEQDSEKIIDQILSTFKFTDQINLEQSNLTPDQIFSEASSQLNIVRSQLTYFRIFGQDKVQYSFGQGTNFAYKYMGKWQIAGGQNAQGIADCSELNNVPDQYRPPCYDAVTKKNNYVDSQGQILNYPSSQMTSYIGN